MQEIQKQIAIAKEEILAGEALRGEGCSKMAELLGYNEGGRIHKWVDWKLNKIILKHRKYHPKEKLIIAICGARGFGKSTVWQRCRLIKEPIKNPYKNFLLFSSKKDFAADMLSPIKQAFESHPNIKKYFENMHGEKKWTGEEILVAPAEKRLNPDNVYTIETGGVGGASASKRFDEILIDDIIGKNNILDSKELDKATETIPTLLPLLRPGGILWFYFMRWGQKDWYEVNVLDYFADYPHFHVIYIPDIVCIMSGDDAGKPLNKKGEIVGEDSPERIPTFPEKFPLHVLDSERKLLKDGYWAQMRCFPRKVSNKLLDPDELKIIPDEEYKIIIQNLMLGQIPEEQIALFIDNANTVSKQANPWSFTLWRWNNQTLDLLFYRKTVMSLTQAAEETVRIILKYRLKGNLKVEKSGLEGNFKYALRPLLDSVGKKHIMPEEHSHEGINKKVRILAAQPFLNRGVLRVCPEQYSFFPFKSADGPAESQLKLLKNEMKYYPEDGTNIPDDLLDGFGAAPRIFDIEIPYYENLDHYKNMSEETRAEIEKARAIETSGERVNEGNDGDFHDLETGEFIEEV